MSNTIYSAILPVISQDKNKFNFVYQITEISTGIKYIGSYGTKKAAPLKALKKYKSSTLDSCFELNQKLNPLNYHYEILSYHSTRDEATLEESRLHFLYDVKCNPNYYNKSKTGGHSYSILPEKLKSFYVSLYVNKEFDEKMEIDDYFQM